MQLNSTAHHSSPQSDDAQPMSPVAPIGSLGLLLHGSAGCQKFDGFTLRGTDRRFVQLPSFIFLLPPTPLLSKGFLLALENRHAAGYLGNNKSDFNVFFLLLLSFLLSIPFALNSYFI